MKEIYVSMDIESDGPIPGRYSMLSFGAAAFDEDGKLIDTFTSNLKTLPGAIEDPNTMKWWSERTAAWDACRSNQVDPTLAMADFNAWLKQLPGKPVGVAYPAGFDFTFIHWYLVNFIGKNPMSFACLDIKTYAMCLLGKGYHETTKKTIPKRWFSDRPHTHVALDDAIEQGELFFNMKREARTAIE